MIKAVIIDTEKNWRISLMDQLRLCGKDIEVVADAEDVKSGIHIIKVHKPDVVFLDVDLSGGSGFDILEYFSNGKNGNQSSTYKFVFTSPDNKYAIKAIKFRVFDYLLKPIDLDDLANTVNKLKIIETSIQASLNNDAIFKKLYQYRESSKKIALSTSERIYIYKINKIVRCESQNTYTMFYFDEGKPVCVCKSIKEFENLLQDYGFERVHQSHLVNLNYIKTYERKAGGYLIMEDGANIPVSQRKKEKFLSKLKKVG